MTVDRQDPLSGALLAVRLVSDDGLGTLRAAIEAEAERRRNESLARARWHTFTTRRGASHLVSPACSATVREVQGGDPGQGARALASMCGRMSGSYWDVRAEGDPTCKRCLDALRACIGCGGHVAAHPDDPGQGRCFSCGQAQTIGSRFAAADRVKRCAGSCEASFHGRDRIGRRTAKAPRCALEAEHDGPHRCSFAMRHRMKHPRGRAANG